MGIETNRNYENFKIQYAVNQKYLFVRFWNYICHFLYCLKNIDDIKYAD